MANYLMNFKGKYRVLPELDKDSHDIPRELDGSIAKGYDDLYIACSYGNKIYHYGHGTLVAYIPSLKRGRNIKKALDETDIPITEYRESDEEVEFRFKAKFIAPIAELLKAKTLGASISPFSVKNLPKGNVEIPSEQMEVYKSILVRVSKGDLLLVHRITSDFLATQLTKKYKKEDKNFNYSQDMKKMKMARQSKEYIYSKGMWDDYLKFLEGRIEEYYANEN